MGSVAKDTAHSSLQCVVEALKSQLEGTRRELQEVKDMKASLEKECVIYQGQLEVWSVGVCYIPGSARGRECVIYQGQLEVGSVLYTRVS